MKIYAASSWRNAFYNDCVHVLRRNGHEVYDFKNPSPGNHGFKWSEIDENWQKWTPGQFKAALNDPIALSGFNSDLNAMKWADACVLILPSGRSAHSEAGWMQGKGKKVFVYMPEPQEPELMYKLFTTICTNQFDLVNAIEMFESIPHSAEKAGTK